MTVHLTNEHLQIYPSVKGEMSLPNVLYNTQESFEGSTKMFRIFRREDLFSVIF